jgi:SNF2 family DNA or RNA helicase
VTLPEVHVGLRPDGGTVEIRRGEGMPESAWLGVRAEWGADGRDSDRRVVAPLERFMARRNSFAQRARVLRFDVRLDDAVRAVIEGAKETRLALDRNLAAPEVLSRREVTELLSRGRFKRRLRQFQARDLAHLLRLEHGANFSVPGAGKTAVAYAIYEAERTRGHIDRLLVVAPLSAFEAWEEEAVECLTDPPTPLRYTGRKIPSGSEVVLVNYQRLAASYADVAAWVRAHNTMVVLDEAHRMKRGRRGEWGNRCLDLAYLAKRRDVLTGTPAPQSAGDFVALVDYLWPGQAIRILPPDVSAPRPAADLADRVADAIRPLFSRTRKDELELPKITRKIVRVPLQGLQADIYAAIRGMYAGNLNMSSRDEREMRRLGRVTMYLLEAATNPKLLAAGSSDADPEVFRHPPLEVSAGTRLADLIETYNVHETPPKFVKLAALVKANADRQRKTLIWSNFVRNILLLREMLSGYMPVVYYGEVPAYADDAAVETRAEGIRRFRSDPRCMVLIANPAAMSEGVSLHRECHDAIYLERTFNAGQYLQSADRIHRLGLRKGQETRITFLETEETIDEVVDARVATKAERLYRMLEDPDPNTISLPDEEDYGEEMDDQDVAALFAHLRGEHVR